MNRYQCNPLVADLSDSFESETAVNDKNPFYLHGSSVKYVTENETEHDLSDLEESRNFVYTTVRKKNPNEIRELNTLVDDEDGMKMYIQKELEELKEIKNSIMELDNFDIKLSYFLKDNNNVSNYSDFSEKENNNRNNNNNVDQKSITKNQIRKNEGKAHKITMKNKSALLNQTQQNLKNLKIKNEKDLFHERGEVKEKTGVMENHLFLKNYLISDSEDLEFIIKEKNELSKMNKKKVSGIETEEETVRRNDYNFTYDYKKENKNNNNADIEKKEKELREKREIEENKKKMEDEIRGYGKLYKKFKGAYSKLNVKCGLLEKENEELKKTVKLEKEKNESIRKEMENKNEKNSLNLDLYRRKIETIYKEMKFKIEREGLEKDKKFSIFRIESSKEISILKIRLKEIENEKRNLKIENDKIFKENRNLQRKIEEVNKKREEEERERKRMKNPFSPSYQINDLTKNNSSALAEKRNHHTAKSNNNQEERTIIKEEKSISTFKQDFNVLKKKYNNFLDKYNKLLSQFTKTKKKNNKFLRNSFEYQKQIKKLKKEIKSLKGKSACNNKEFNDWHYEENIKEKNNKNEINNTRKNKLRAKPRILNTKKYWY